MLLLLEETESLSEVPLLTRVLFVVSFLPSLNESIYGTFNKDPLLNYLDVSD